MPLHEKIRKWRKAKDLKQWAVAELLDITQPAYSDYECAKSEPPAGQIEKMAEIFDVPISEFYTDDEFNAQAFIALKKECEHKDILIVELRKENAYLEKIIELLGGKGK